MNTFETIINELAETVAQRAYDKLMGKLENGRYDLKGDLYNLVDKRVDQYANQTRMLEAAVGNLETKVNLADARVDQYSQRTRMLETEVKNLEIKVRLHEENLTDHEKDINELQTNAVSEGQVEELVSDAIENHKDNDKHETDFDSREFERAVEHVVENAIEMHEDENHHHDEDWTTEERVQELIDENCGDKQIKKLILEFINTRLFKLEAQE